VLTEGKTLGHLTFSHLTIKPGWISPKLEIEVVYDLEVSPVGRHESAFLCALCINGRFDSRYAG